MEILSLLQQNTEDGFQMQDIRPQQFAEEFISLFGKTELHVGENKIETIIF